MKQSNTFASLIIIIIILGTVIGYLVAGNSNNEVPANRDVACTEEAKLCPDGSGVGRQGPNCEFPDCPTETPAIKPQ